MNRAERRKTKNASQVKTYTLTIDQIEQMKKEVAEEATEKAFLMFLSIPIMVLHDKFGFGKSRLEKLMDYMLVWFGSVQSGETRLMELVKVAEDECGIRVNFKRR